MKVTLINHSDTLGGASVATFRLMEALRLAGVDARMLVARRASDSPHVVRAAGRFATAVPFLREHLRIFTHNGFNRDDLFKVSIADVGLPLHRHPLVTGSDAIILNWVNQGMLSLDEIGLIARAKPTVWTMHDMWNLTGVCHHAGTCTRYTDACGCCPLLHSAAGATDLSATTFARKAALYSGSPIHFVAVSRWLAGLAEKSALTRNFPVEVIHCPMPVSQLTDAPSMTRAEAGLPAAGRLVVMCAARLDDPVKNLPDAVEALNALAGTDAVAVFVGDIRDSSVLGRLEIPFVQTGPVYDAARLRSIFAYASAVLSSSRYESFGATLLEGQTLGAVPVAYVHDGRSDIIDDGVTGYAAGPGIRSLGQALRLALERPLDRTQLLGAAARYSYETVAARYIDLLGRIAR